MRTWEADKPWAYRTEKDAEAHKEKRSDEDGSAYHGVQELDAALQLGSSLAELPEEQPSDWLPLAEAAVVLLCRDTEASEVIVTQI